MIVLGFAHNFYVHLALDGFHRVGEGGLAAFHHDRPWHGPRLSRYGHAVLGLGGSCRSLCLGRFFDDVRPLFSLVVANALDDPVELGPVARQRFLQFL